MKADGLSQRFRESILSVGEFAEETADQRGRRRIIVGILWLSAVFLTLGALSGEGPWVSAMDALKAASHIGALAALRVFPRRIARYSTSLLVSTSSPMSRQASCSVDFMSRACN